MNVWLDDVREMPEGFNLHVTTYDDAILSLMTGKVLFISFDHDLGDGKKTGYDVAQWIEQQAFQYLIPRLKWDIHSADSLDAQKITSTMESAERHWSDQENISRGTYDGKGI
jgi:hypothetical protein